MHRSEKANGLAKIVWGDPESPTLSQLGRYLQRFEDLIFRDDEHGGPRYNANTIILELRQAGLTDPQIQRLRDLAKSAFDKIIEKVEPTMISQWEERTATMPYDRRICVFDSDAFFPKSSLTRGACAIAPKIHAAMRQYFIQSLIDDPILDEIPDQPVIKTSARGPLHSLTNVLSNAFCTVTMPVITLGFVGSANLTVRARLPVSHLAHHSYPPENQRTTGDFPVVDHFPQTSPD